MPALVNTVIMTALSLVIAIPFGIFSAIFLVEYAKINLLRYHPDYGGDFIRNSIHRVRSVWYVVFRISAKGGYSILAGAFTMSIMILPLIMRTTEEALKSVPDTYREGSFGLGPGKLRTIFRIVLPAAVPGIMAGVILAIGRIMGETAALMYTAGTVPKMASSPMDSGRTLAVHMYNLSSEGLYMDQAYATAVILLIVVVGMNTLSAVAARKLTKGTR